MWKKSLNYLQAQEQTLHVRAQKPSDRREREQAGGSAFIWVKGGGLGAGGLSIGEFKAKNETLKRTKEKQMAQIVSVIS